MCPAFVWNVIHLQARLQFKRFHRQVVRPAVSGRAIEQARFGLGQRDQFLDARNTCAGMGDQVERRGRRQTHRHQMLERLERCIARKMRVDGDDRRIGHQQGVTIRLRRHDQLRGQQPACARTVVHNDLLAHVLRKFLANRARQHIGRATGCGGHNNADRLVWKGLGLHGGSTHQRHGTQRKQCDFSHVTSPFVIAEMTAFRF